MFASPYAGKRIEFSQGLLCMPDEKTPFKTLHYVPKYSSSGRLSGYRFFLDEGDIVMASAMPSWKFGRLNTFTEARRTFSGGLVLRKHYDRRIRAEFSTGEFDEILRHLYA